MNIWQMVTWDVARAGGFTAFGLLTLSVAIGTVLHKSCSLTRLASQASLFRDGE